MPRVINEVIMPNKTCIKCKIEKDVSKFTVRGKYADGSSNYRGECKLCTNKKWRDGYANPELKIKEKCREYASLNKAKISALQKEWKLTNKEKMKLYHKSYQENNKSKISAKKIEWNRNNQGKRAAARTKRRAVKLNATPSWADFEAINSIYSLSSFLTMTTFGNGYHVDHIIPLQGKNVCGLHVEGNLRVLRAEHNLSKSNNF